MCAGGLGGRGQVDHINNEKRLMAQISYPFIVNMPVSWGGPLGGPPEPILEPESVCSACSGWVTAKTSTLFTSLLSRVPKTSKSQGNSAA